MSRLGNIAKVGGGAGLFAAAFSAMDIYATRSVQQKQYKIIEKLLSDTEKLQQATANLKATQKETVQHNNESLFGGLSREV